MGAAPAAGGFCMTRTIVSILIMAISSFAGLFLGALLNDAVGGMILLALISGIACIIHALESQGR